ncbi:MAG: redoxin domain-containing protein, partial [Thermoanaerobaculia bacterium]|nr:redoxin domain-containing protein [Thermoanaerobaculia bacterium]
VGRTTSVERTLADPTDLWVVPADLTRINDFVLKPEGACIDDLCVPIRQDRDSDIFVTRDGQGWINVTELADRLEQAWVSDADARVWSFGDIPYTRKDFLDRAMAPDFTLPDREGRPVRLADFRGKKVMILSWASW